MGIESGLVGQEYLARLKWADSHGATGSHLGAGMLYHALVYMLRAERCVILGSGAMFVPAVCVEAQRLLVREKLIPAVDVTVVDADIGPWGRPAYTTELFDRYPEIRLDQRLTVEAAKDWGRGPIGLLHVDADHTFAGCLADLYAWWPHTEWKRAAITVHDTLNVENQQHEPPIGTWAAAITFAQEHGLGVVNFPVGAGTALIAPMEGL